VFVGFQLSIVDIITTGLLSKHFTADMQLGMQCI